MKPPFEPSLLTQDAAASREVAGTPTPRPRLAFLGTGWIGMSRLNAIVAADCADVVVVADRNRDAAAAASVSAGRCAVGECLDDVLAMEPDGLVIATPSALHAEQAIAALERGIAVFCQKPLARTAPETQRVIDAARASDCLLGVDLSYRYTAAARRARELLQGNTLGEIFAADLVFHNAYGPDKDWFYDKRLSGGGCVIDLGIHLVDLAMWLLGERRVSEVRSTLCRRGAVLPPDPDDVEDYAIASFRLGRVAVSLACSWGLHAGRDAVIEASFYGTRGGVSICNVNGSFYDLAGLHHQGTSSRSIARPPDDWSGRAAAEWARRLARGGADGPRFDPAVQQLASVARVLDDIYGETS